MRRIRSLAAVAAVPLSLGLLLAPAASAAPGGGNSAAAKLCQQGGYVNYQRTDGTRFADESACTSYAARGGRLVPVPVAKSLDIRVAPTSDPRYCGVFVTGTGFAPNTTYPATVKYVDYFGDESLVPKLVMTDANGAIIDSGQLSSRGNDETTSVTVTVDGLTAGPKYMTC